jgi:casein kinase I family protein HRR25
MYNYLDSDSDDNHDDILNQTFFNKYLCIKKLGKGSFGSIYQAKYNNEEYALKFEQRKKNIELLQNEAAIMNYLKGPNIPTVKSYGITSKYNILIMQLLGKDLEKYLKRRKKFSIKTVCMLGFQMINILENIHEKHILHRDIKPENFVMGLNQYSNVVYLIDFGLAKKYRSITTLIQYPLTMKKRFTGTARYASINALKGYEHSRRDDLESLGYIFVYFLKGELPWQKIKAKNKEEKYNKILQKKLEISSKELCRGIPTEFEIFLDYIKKLKYEEKPDYDKLRNLLDKIMKDENYKNDYIFDWTLEEETNKELTTNDNSINNKNEENKDNDDMNYHIKRNNKIFYNNFEEPEIVCSSACSIF